MMQVSLKAVLPFLEGALRAAGEQQRNAAVVKSLRRSENLNVREDLTRCKQRYASCSASIVTFELHLVPSLIWLIGRQHSCCQNE